jgi:hypothetical protein
LGGGVIAVVPSKNGVPIRLTGERWAHVLDEHGELAGMQQGVLDTVEHPERILAGKIGELFAVREVETGKYLVAVYSEVENDGFIITAFLTRRIRSLNTRNQVWP